VDEDIVIPIAGMLFVLVLVFGSMLIYAFGKRIQRRESLPRANPETDQRLERIEQAVDAMAVEVERIAEGQRFVTKLLSDKAPERVGLSRGSSS
jgi:Na+-transporting methylmalonyl-CoA/oxaloacetate decarboxylase gamma subunit